MFKQRNEIRGMVNVQYVHKMLLINTKPHLILHDI
jgi:hypothetical protein